jgi:hypothetical protein
MIKIKGFKLKKIGHVVGTTADRSLGKYVTKKDKS